MKKTYAPSGIVVGVLLGFLVAIKVNTALGVVTAIAASALAWIIIRAIEHAGDRAADAIDNAIARKKNAGNPPEKTKLSDTYSQDQRR